MGATFTECEVWYEQAVQDNFGWYDHKQDRIRNHFQEKREDEEWEDEDDFDEDGYDDDDLDDEPAVLRLPTERKSAGRNDPCPCGSGKKHKKCCLNKDRDKPIGY